MTTRKLLNQGTLALSMSLGCIACTLQMPAQKGQSPGSFPVNSCFPAQPSGPLWESVWLGIILECSGQQTRELEDVQLWADSCTPRKQRDLALCYGFLCTWKSRGFLCSMRIQPVLKCKHSKKAGVPFQKPLLMEYSTVMMKNRNVCIWPRLSWRPSPVGMWGRNNQ